MGAFIFIVHHFCRNLYRGCKKPSSLMKMFRSFDIRISSNICILIFQFIPNKDFFNGLISRLFATRMWQLLPFVMRAVSHLLLPIFLLCSTIIITHFYQRVQDPNPVLIIAFLPAALTNIFKRTDFPKMFR
jgi:hypothetical protein